MPRRLLPVVGWLGLALAVAGCGETKRKIEHVDLALDLSVCLGDVDGLLPGSGASRSRTTCRTRLDALVAASDVNTCLLVQEAQDGGGGPVHHVPLRWQGKRLEPAGGGAPEIPVSAGKRIRAELYFHGTGFDPGLCGVNGLTFGSRCDANTFCVAKFSQSEATIAGDGTAAIDFKGAGENCSVEWRTDMSETAEVCDGQDNDCDGLVDEDFMRLPVGQRLGDTCSAGTGQCATEGRIVCAEGGTACNAVPGEPGEEVCDEIDNDCNGRTDEGLDCGFCRAGDVRTCNANLPGVCVQGRQECEVPAGAATGAFGECRGADGRELPRPGQFPEICDGLDNDCDGRADEGFNLDEACVVGRGACERPGRRICDGGGGVTCDGTPGDPAPERCNGLDDDCDGEVDEDFNVDGPCAVGEGTCRAEGLRICDGQGGVTCSAMPGQPGPELCGDARDNDCDGVEDEGFDTLGNECTVGRGACERTGTLVCDPADRTRVRCSVDPGAPELERCDQLDNNCDGSVDEGFDLTSNVGHCGACNAACDLPNANPRCTAGRCEIQACIGGFQDNDRNPDNGCECHPGNEDEPDHEYLDTNCDGVDGRRNGPVFVSVIHGSDADGTGRVDSPFQSLARAIGVAAPQREAVYLDAGVYDVGALGVAVPSGVRIHGGYRYNRVGHVWSRDSRLVNPTVLTGASVVMRYEELRHATMLDNLIVEAADAVQANRPSVGVLAVNVGEHLTMRLVTIRGGAGGPGSDGTNGANGTRAAETGNPGSASDGVCRGCAGTGGTNPTCPAGTAGGDAGAGARSDAGNAQPQAGRAGEGGALGGAGGPAAPAFQQPGGDGLPGQTGASGNPSDKASRTGRLSADRLWVPRASPPGGDGVNGGGGGGAGGGGSINAGNGIGGGGGGGGAGGCAGARGGGATSGGASFGLQIVGGIVRLMETEVVGGAGGRGGRGGTGGLGAVGAEGGTGGGTGNCNTCGPGGSGGAGGRGGCGGHAGGASGGPTYAIFRASVADPAQFPNSSFVFVGLDGRQIADQAAATLRLVTPGEPGRGGTGGGQSAQHLAACGPGALDGDDGFAGRVGCCRNADSCGNLDICD